MQEWPVASKWSNDSRECLFDSGGKHGRTSELFCCCSSDSYNPARDTGQLNGLHVAITNLKKIRLDIRREKGNGKRERAYRHSRDCWRKCSMIHSQHLQDARSSHRDVPDHIQRTLGSCSSPVRLLHETCDSNLLHPFEERQASHVACHQRFHGA